MIEKITGIDGTGLPVRGNNIDTDRIIPARFLRSVTFEGLEQHLFEDDRAQAAGTHPLENPRYEGASILLVNVNFGCGSSREHAPQAIRRRGIRAVIGESFSEIFFGNSVALGMPCVTAGTADVELLMSAVERTPSVRLTVDLERLRVTCGEASVPLSIPPAARESFIEGTWDATGLLLDRYEDVERVAAALPYVNRFR
jgi:3-isopropylmalate/(R)-2-methylmalate dehydratase small subunit